MLVHRDGLPQRVRVGVDVGRCLRVTWWERSGRVLAEDVMISGEPYEREHARQIVLDALRDGRGDVDLLRRALTAIGIREEGAQGDG